MEADKENTSSSYLQTSFQSPSAANYDRCTTGGVGRSKTMRLLTSGMGTTAAESEVILIFSCLIAVISQYHCLLKSRKDPHNILTVLGDSIKLAQFCIVICLDFVSLISTVSLSLVG